ncbi:MAG TPA: diadenylate cyclase CdaA [Spirochaetota bacterium]|nr:diadenylate cyclase CdaA [Spirochaetota bacterium]
MRPLIYFENVTWVTLLDILLVAIIIYNIYAAVSRTRALPVLKAFVLILFLTFLADIFHLSTIKTILAEVRRWMFLIIIVLFPAEVRNWLYSLGRTNYLRRILQPNKSGEVGTIVGACEQLAQSKLGALIAIEGNDHLQMIAETGNMLNAELSQNLLLTIFNKNGPLHDGAVIVRGNKIVSAGSYIPNISANPNIKKTYGTRHRAGLGLSEQSDAAVIIISEEKQQLSFAYRGELFTNINPRKLSAKLQNIIGKTDKP